METIEPITNTDPDFITWREEVCRDTLIELCLRFIRVSMDVARFSSLDPELAVDYASWDHEKVIDIIGKAERSRKQAIMLYDKYDALHLRYQRNQQKNLDMIIWNEMSVYLRVAEMYAKYWWDKCVQADIMLLSLEAIVYGIDSESDDEEYDEDSDDWEDVLDEEETPTSDD